MKRSTPIRNLLLVLLAALVLGLSSTSAGIEFWKSACQVSGFSGWQENTALLEIHLIDVGKADSILIRSRGHAALLDAGKVSEGTETADYLARHGIGELDALIMSHPDKDHIGGMPLVLREMPVRSFVQGPLPEEQEPNTQEFKDMERLLSEKQVPRRVLSPGESVLLGDAVLTAIGPVEGFADANNSSLVLRVTCGDFTALFCGDMEEKAERALILSGQDLRADLLKVGHHGSATSTSQEFLDQVLPQYAAISTGPDRNKLPRAEVLARLEEAGAEIYRTDTDGDVLFVYDGERVTVTTEK